MIIFFCWVAWLWLLILTFPDLFQRDASGRAKAAWDVFVIVLPFLGALRQLRPPGRHEQRRRRRGRDQAGQAAARQRCDHAAGFDQLKAKALA
jgi:hypothetical protein